MGEGHLVAHGFEGIVCSLLGFAIPEAGKVVFDDLALFYCFVQELGVARYA